MQKYVLNKLMLYKNEFNKSELNLVTKNINIWSKVYQIIMIDFINEIYK